jgi:uncharacterized membrane protein
MGILSQILFAPVALPVSGVRWVLTQVQTAVEAELTDDTSLREELLELQMRLELGEIEEDEYTAREAEIFAGLREIRARRRQAASAQASRQP